ncbi:MAG: glycosyl transferase, partial [Mycobacteriaceae bacterium]
AIAAGVDLLRNDGLDMACPWPQQRADSIAERLVQPLQQWSWMTSLPLGIAVRSHRPSMAAVCGQFLVVDSTAYRAIGGHSAVANCVLDDLELARALRRKGFRTAPADGSRLAQCRMYTGAGELRAGYGKSLWTAFGSPLQATALFTALVAIYVLPPAVALAGSEHARRWGLLGYLAAVGSRLVSAREAGTQPWPDVLAQPLSVLALAALTVDSHRQRRRGSLYWKGRHLA